MRRSKTIERLLSTTHTIGSPCSTAVATAMPVIMNEPSPVKGMAGGAGPGAAGAERLGEREERQTRVGDHADLDGVDAGDLARVDVDLHEARRPREVVDGPARRGQGGEGGAGREEEGAP